MSTYYRIDDPIKTDIPQFLQVFNTPVAQKIMNDKVKEAMSESLTYMLRPIRFLTPFRTGALRRSETIAPMRTIDAVVRGEIYTDLYYAQYVEPWSRMFYRGADVSIEEVNKIFNEKVGEGIQIFNGLGRRTGRGPSLRGTSVGQVDEWFG